MLRLMKSSWIFFLLPLGPLYAGSAPFSGIEEAPSAPTHVFGTGFSSPIEAFAQPLPSLVEEWNEVSDFDARLELLKLLTDRKDTAQEALEHIQRLVEEKPDDLEIQLLLGGVWRGQGA